jgi:esterase/lipase superfamily enzyme
VGAALFIFIFSQERFFDFEDFGTPVKSRTKMLNFQMQSTFEFEEIRANSKIYSYQLAVNQVSFMDSYYQNPWVEEQGSTEQFLSAASTNAMPADPYAANLEFIAIQMQPDATKVIRSRRVYNVIDLIAEVSGFADLFMILGAFLLGNFYQTQSLEKALLKHLGPQFLTKRPKRQQVVLANSDKIKTLKIIGILKQRIRLKVNLWALIVLRNIPGCA